MSSTTKWGDRQARRRDILHTARTLLEREGYARLNIRDVAQGAGISLGTLYTYFASKETLYATLYTQRLEQFDIEIAPICATATTPEQLFTAVAERYLEVYRVFGREFNLWTLLLDPQDRPQEIAQPLIQAAAKVMATLQTALSRFLGQDGLRLAEPARAGLVLPLLWATFNGLADHFTSARHQMHPYTWTELTGFAARTLTAGLTARTDSAPGPAPATTSEGDR